MQDVAQTCVPLRTVTGEAEEVGSLHLQGCLLGTRDAVDERHLRVVLGVVGNRDAFVTGERPENDIGAVLLDDLADLLDGAVGGVIATTDADNLDRKATSGGTGESLGSSGPSNSTSHRHC